MESTDSTMATLMKVNGKIIKCTATESTRGLGIIKRLRVLGEMERKMVSTYLGICITRKSTFGQTGNYRRKLLLCLIND
jgi:hypothetical protein